MAKRTADSPTAPIDQPPTPDEIQACISTLEWLTANPSEADAHDDLGEAVARTYKRVRKQRRRAAAAQHPAPPKPPEEPGPTIYSCYICRSAYTELTAPYPRLCRTCASKNFAHRMRRTDLTGRRALITGGRVKVGYQTALKLLRDGAEVIVTTRFPADAARRYAQEPDFDQWKDRLTLYALDFRSLSSVQAFTMHLRNTISHLNIVINNAAQTIRRPPEAYRDLLAFEADRTNQLPASARDLLARTPAPFATTQVAPPQSLLPDLAPGSSVQGAIVSPRPPSSWLLPLELVSPGELAEVLAINAMAPFILCAQLDPLLRASPHPDRYIVNVSSAEGQFAPAKFADHPHTNMAKAALNMLTRTSAERCAEHGIYMNSVDPGWITHMKSVDPRHPENEPAEDPAAFGPPLDEVDGAARIYDPIIRGTKGEPIHGVLLRNYTPVPW